MAGARLHQQAKEMKEAMVRKNGIVDLTPFMVVMTDDHHSYFGHCGTGMSEALEAGARMADIVGASVLGLRADIGMVNLKRMMLVVEGFTETMPDRASARSLQHGQLSEDYANNPDSTVSEVLMTNIWDYHDGKINFTLWLTRFHYTDRCVLVWDEDQEPMNDEGDSRVEGQIAAIGRMVMRT